MHTQELPRQFGNQGEKLVMIGSIPARLKPTLFDAAFAGVILANHFQRQVRRPMFFEDPAGIIGKSYNQEPIYQHLIANASEPTDCKWRHPAPD